MSMFIIVCNVHFTGQWCIYFDSGASHWQVIVWGNHSPAGFRGSVAGQCLGLCAEKVFGGSVEGQGVWG